MSTNQARRAQVRTIRRRNGNPGKFGPGRARARDAERTAWRERDRPARPRRNVAAAVLAALNRAGRRALLFARPSEPQRSTSECNCGDVFEARTSRQAIRARRQHQEKKHR